MTRAERLALALILAALRRAFERSPLGRYRARYDYTPRNRFVPRHRRAVLEAHRAAA